MLTVLLAFVFAVSVVVGFLYSWLGLGYAMSFVVLFSFLVFGVNDMLPYILLSQATCFSFCHVGLCC